MRSHHHTRTGLQGEIDGRHRCADARIGGYLAILDGYVEIGTDQDTPALEVQIGHFDNGHFLLHKKTGSGEWEVVSGDGGRFPTTHFLLTTPHASTWR